MSDWGAWAISEQLQMYRDVDWWNRRREQREAEKVDSAWSQDYNELVGRFNNLVANYKQLHDGRNALAEALERSRAEDDRRIRDLTAQNAKLRAENEDLAGTCQVLRDGRDGDWSYVAVLRREIGAAEAKAAQALAEVDRLRQRLADAGLSSEPDAAT